MKFYASYVHARMLPPRTRDPVAKAWIDGKHEVAARLIEHARRQYDVRFRLTYAVRPWAQRPAKDAVSGHEGVLWHAEWVLGDWEVPPQRLWRDVSQRREVAEMLVHLLLEASSITATFSALDPPGAVADSVGEIFDFILMDGQPRSAYVDMDAARRHYDEQWAEVAQLPARVQTKSPLTLLDPLNPDAFSIFGA
jgi:hypothetical protein